MRNFLFPAVILASLSVSGQQSQWPVLKQYSGEHIHKVAMPVGGIGTGTISVGGNGQLRDVEIMNKPGKGFFGSVSSKQAPCFMVFTQDGSGKKLSKALIGPVSPQDFAGHSGSVVPNHGLPRFDSATFDAAYPFATVNLSDRKMPISARVRVFNPFIPADAENSGIPIAVLRYEIRNKTDQPIEAAVAGTLDNFIGMDGYDLEFNGFNREIEPIGAKKNRNTYRKTSELAGIFMSSDSVDKNSRNWGTMALITTEQNKGYTISYRQEFNPKGWNANVSDMWNDFADDGIYKDTSYPEKVNSPRGGLAVKFQLAAGETKEIEFLLTWHFPNRMDWFDQVVIGNYYTTKYADAWDVAEKTASRLKPLEKKTLDFVNLFLGSDYPEVFKEAALFNTSTLRSQTTFRTPDGNFFGWEGSFNTTGSCWGNCSHVWNYELASPFLFGELAKSMRNIEFQYGLRDDIPGLLGFRVRLPLKKNNTTKLAAADGQMGTIMKAYREWQLSGDDNFLRANWPAIKQALSFAWIPGGWDADKDGVMEGCQHNTMDIEYYGPNPEIEFWYLGALKAAAAMAAHLKDSEFEKTCLRLYQNGSKWTDANLFNGEFYIQKIQPIPDRNKIATGLLSSMGSTDLINPDFQIGEGCLVDQLVGQNMAHVCGLGYLAKPENIKKTLGSIRKYNTVASFGDHFNNMRSYALGNESGLKLIAYPDITKTPAIPVSYAAEVWSGLEYAAASGMIYEGMTDDAIAVINDVRNRYNGNNRNPFNEEECGNHYVRAMASWGAILAFSEFRYSAVEGKFSITSKPGNYFWSNGYSWGNAEVGTQNIKINVQHGTLNIKSVERGNNTIKLKKTITLKEGDHFVF